MRRTLQGGIIVSLLLHAALLTIMGLGSVRSWLDQQPVHMIQASATYARDVRPEDAEPEDVLQATVVIEAEDPAPVGIQQQLDQARAKSEQLSTPEKIEALDETAARLQRISSEAAVEDVAKRLQSWLGLTPRAQRPTADDVAVAELETDLSVGSDSAADSEGEFDLETAQLHDVRRLEGSDSRPRYVCIMLDAEGRTLEVPLSEAEGEPIYTLMEKIKASPLLEQIYRQLAMPMLDQLVRAERAAATAAAANANANANAKTAAGEDPHEKAGSDPPGDVGDAVSR